MTAPSPDLTCDAQIWPSWSNRWIRCGSPVRANGKCVAYHHVAGRSPAPAAARPAEPTGELREQVAEWLFRKVVERDRLVRAVWPELPESNRTGWLAWADELLAGPLAPLLAKLRAGLALADELERRVVPRSFHPAGTHSDGASQAFAEAAERLRTALAPLAGQHTTDEEQQA